MLFQNKSSETCKLALRVYPRNELLADARAAADLGIFTKESRDSEWIQIKWTLGRRIRVFRKYDSTLR